MSFLHGINYLHRSALLVLSVTITGFMLATGSTPNVISYLTVHKLAGLVIVLQLCEVYRQRFYLDTKNEWGLHWRAALLQYAKWPWIGLALLDVLSSKEKPYIVTAKVKSGSKKHLLLLPNLIVVIFLSSAWIIGYGLELDVHPFVYICAAMFMIASIILIWTDVWEYPAPYIKELKINAALNPNSGPVSEN